MIRSVWAFAAVWLALPVGAAEPLRLAVLHTNDVHGWIYPKAATWFDADPKRPIGGFAAAAEVVKREKLPKLVLDGGDWFQGTPESAFTSGVSAVDSFNALGYDAVVVGNHDFDYGLAQLERLARRMKSPVLGANVYREADGERPPYLVPHVLREIEGVKIGVFGLLTRKMRDLSFAENFAGLSFRREAEEAMDQVRALRAKGATVIIAVNHVGFMEPGMGVFEDDKFIAGEVPGIDLVIGGHTHTRLKEGVRDARNGSLIVQAGSYLSQLGRVELSIDRDTGRVVASTAALIDLWVDQIGQDPEISRLIRRHQEEADLRMSVVLATATVTLTRNRAGEAAIGAWFTDCVRDWSATDIAMQNHGGIRAELPAGPVTLRRIFEIMPFDNRVATVTLTGAQLLDTLERGVSGAAGMLQVSGVTLTYKPEAQPGRRVLAVKVAGKPLDKAKRYTVAAADFLLKRGDGFAALGQGEGATFTNTLIRDVLAGCARKSGVIKSPELGRIVPES